MHLSNAWHAMWKLLSARERRRLLILLVGVLCTAALQTAGVGSILPFITLAAKPNVVNANDVYAHLYHLLGAPPISRFVMIAGIAVILILCIGNGISALTNYGIIRYGAMRGYSFSSRLLGKYMAQPYEYFLTNSSATLSRNILSEVYRAVDGVLIPLLDSFAQAFVAASIVVFLFVVNPSLAAIVAAIVGGLYGVVFLSTRRRSERLGNERIEASRREFKITNETLESIKDVKLTHSEVFFHSLFSESSLVYAKREAGARIIAKLPRFALETVAFSGVVILLLILMGGSSDFQNAVPFVGAYAVAGYKIMPALQSLLSDVNLMRYNTPSLNVLSRDLGSTGDIQTTQSSDHLDLQRQTAIRFDDVSYVFPTRRDPAVRNTSFEICRNTTVGIVGMTGSGKTTLIDLLLGLLEPTSGRIWIDGIELKDVHLLKWQYSVGYVPQHISLIDDTFVHNIAFGVPEEKIDMAAVREAASIARIDNFIDHELPDHYETLLGDRGVRLSGGQRQRVGIARALYRDPAVLVLDEATSALDSQTERAVIDAISALAHTKTIVMIAHRMSTIKHCDQIIVVDGGSVVGKGEYDQLISKNSYFRSIAL